ncbi:MAG TPA: hypothetical protein VGR38_09685, partial [Candidatus Polarisedimenticolia bacterium]|nr:hypothetical protein [Candidatus Polarisedimenticolia bacterium]
MQIRFLAGNLAMVGVTVKLAHGDSLQNNKAVEERVEAFRRDLLEGRDPWARRLRAVEPVLERVVLDHEKGSLVRVTRKAAFEEQERVSRFFEDTLIQARVERRELESELTLVPSRGGRATRSQREQFAEKRGPWLATLSRYFASVGALYDFLRDHPSHVRPCYELLFQDLKIGE